MAGYTARAAANSDLPPRRPTITQASFAGSRGGVVRPVNRRKVSRSAPSSGRPNTALPNVFQLAQDSAGVNHGPISSGDSMTSRKLMAAALDFALAVLGILSITLS